MLSDDEIREFVNSTIDAAERLVGDFRSILSYIDAPLALNFGEPVALDALPDMLVEICKDLKLQSVDISLPDDLRSLTVALTPDALEMIFHELLENTRKFHPRRTPTVEISIGQIDEQFVLIRIADDGVSLSPEQISWMWLPYVQGEKDFTGELPGMGLGFPMVATLVWKAGGDLHVRNRSDGPGLIVELEIPLESAARARPRPAMPYSE